MSEGGEKLRLVLAGAVIVLIAVACGGGDSPTSTVVQEGSGGSEVTAVSTSTVARDSSGGSDLTEAEIAGYCGEISDLTSACDADGAKPTGEPSDESAASNPARLLSLLPTGSLVFIFAEVELVWQRSSMRQEVEYGFEELSKRTYGLIGSDLLASGEIESIAFATTNNDNASATILLGNFEGFSEVLREAPSLADANSRFDPPGVIDPYRGLELFVFPWHDDLFIAVPDSETLLLADSPDLLRETIDRRLDGGDLDASLAGLLSHIDRVDFLVAGALEDGQGDGSSPPPPTFYAHAGFLNDGETSTIYAYFEFAEDANLEEAIDLLSNQPDLSDLFYGYKSDTIKPIGELWQDGRAVIAKAVVPDKDVPDLFLSN